MNSLIRRLKFSSVENHTHAYVVAALDLVAQDPAARATWIDHADAP
jgi:hypothetical protein